jgi:hypothetical protein
VHLLQLALLLGELDQGLGVRVGDVVALGGLLRVGGREEMEG